MEIHRSFKIPLKARRPSEDCQYTLPADSREAKEIEYAIKRQTWDINDLDRAVSISLIKKVDNPSLEKEYREKKSQLREEGRSTKELSQQLAFCLETDESRVKEICQIGLECCGTDHTLGDGGMGVTVWRCPDLCIRAFSWPASGSAFLLVFKIVKGRVKPVTPRVSPGTPNLEPTPNHDCHISRNTVSSSVTDLTTLLRNTQYYLYEYDDEGLPSKRPRHCLPFAVVPLKRNEMASPRSPKRPLAFIEIPVSPAKQLTKHAEELKAPSFADDDGILVWRGLVTSGNRSLGRVSLLAGHKLGVNFWKSYLDVSRKIPLRQLGLMLPGDVKNGWKWPLLYRNCALSVCTVKQAQGEACEALKSFTRHLVTKAKSAGVLCIDSITTMFLLPSGKLAIHLGFCETELPPRLFCIVCRRHASPLMLKSACGYSTFRPYSSTTVNNEATAIDPSSFNFKTRYTSKIIVSSTENSRRLDPKLTPPRQTLKRSLSFSYSPAKVAKKGLQRVVRSASSSVGVSSKEETPIRPAILPILEVSCDGSRRKDNCVWGNSCAWDNKSQIAAGSSHISFNSLADGKKFEEGNFYMDSEKTIILEGSTKNLLTLKTSPTVSKNATLSYLQSEERSCQSLQLSEEQVTCNTSPNLEGDELASSTDYPLLSPHSRQIWVKTRKSLSKPSLVEVTLQESTYAQSGPQSATAVLRDGDLSLRSTNANDWALQSSRLASTPSSLAQPTVQASIQESNYKENEHRFSVTDKSESETSLRSDSQAHLPVRWSGVTETSSRVPGGSDQIFCVREMTASSSSNRKHCNVAESSTSRSELVFECPRGKMKESGVIPLCGENVSSSCSRESHDHPQLIFPGQNCIPFLWCGSDDSPSQKEDTVASRKGFLVHPGMNGSCSGLSNVSADKKTFFCVDVEKDLEGPLDKLEVQSSCLRGDGLNPIPPANVPQENYNSEMYDSLEIVDMEISDSSTDLNNEDALHNLKVAADLSENFPLCTDGDLHDNLETVDMEMSKTSNFETLHLNDGVFLNSTSIEASLTEIPCTGCEDKRERVNVEISDLTPDQTVSSQPYSYVPLTDCYDSPRNHLNGSSKTHDSIGLHKRVNGEEQRLSQTMLASFPRTGLVLNSAFLEPSCLVSSLPSTSRENTFETIGGNATEQTKSSSMDPSVTTAISTTRESTLESQDVTKPIDMDISDDSEVITVSCEKDNNGGYRLEVFCNLSKKDHSQSQDTNSNTQISAKAWEETVEETAEETAEHTVSLGVTSDHPKFTSQERSSSFSSTSLLREHGTCSSITEELHQAIEHSVPSASASDTQPQNSFPKEQESKCGAVFTYGQVSSFSLSPPKSPKVSVRKLKILQAAFKAETDMSGFTSDSRTTPSSPANVVKYISHKSSFHSTVKHCKESRAETSESSDCTGVQNSSGSSAKGCKTPVMSSTAFEKEVTVVPEQKGVCRGGVIEMSLIEDWGFHTNDSDCSERQLTVDDRCQPQTGEGDGLDTLDAHKTFQTSETCPVIEDNDFPEPETVVCSPVAPSEAFNSEFIGESGFRYPSAGDRKTTAAEEETSLTQRFRGDLPELMRSSDVKPATMLSPSKPSPAEEYSENVTAINERDSKESSTIVPQLASDMDSAPDVPKACPTTECSETGGFKIEWSHTEISIGDSLVSDDDVSVAGSSRERTQKYSGASESVNTNRVLKIPVARSGMVVEPRSPEEVQDTILLETLGASYLPVSRTHSSKAEKIGMETVPLSGSTIRFDNLSCTGEGKIMEAEVSSTVAHKNDGCPKLVAQESVISFPGQVNEEILSDGKKDRDSFWELLDEEHATDLAGEEERKNCSLKVPVEEEKLNAEDRAAATETKYAIVDYSVPGKEIAESVNSTQNTEAVMPASLQDIGREDCQEFSDVTTSTAAKGRESHLESRAGKRMFDHVSDDRTMQTARRIEEYADCSRTESRVVSTKAESMAGIRTITSKRRSEVSSESFSTIPQKAKPGERTVEPVLKWDIRCKTEQLSSKTTSGSGKAAKDRKPSDRISKSEKTQTCDEVNSESSSIKDRPCLNSLRRGFAAAEGRILDERTVREGDIKSRKSAEIKTCTSSKRGQSSIDSEGSSIGDTRNSNRYAYSSKRAPPLYSTGTPHAYKELEVRARQEKCTNDDFSAPYRDTRGRTESLKDTNHLQRENMVQYTKKVPWEPDQWAVHKLGRKRQKMTPPPPLISLERGFRHGQDPHQRWGEGEASNGHNHFYPPCCGQPKNLFPRVDYITEQQCSRMVWKHRSYPCWVSPQLSLPPVTNKGRAILHHLIPDYPRWYPEGTFSLNDPRIGQNQFEQVYPGSLVHGKPVCVPSPGRGQSVLAAPPPLIPGLWAMPAIPCHQPYPVYRPR